MPWPGRYSFNRLGEIRDQGFEQQRYRASGLNLVTAAIVLWNTVYLERATNALRGHGQPIDDALLQYLSPLGWEHINLTGDYQWRSSSKVGVGKFRPLRPLPPPITNGAELAARATRNPYRGRVETGKEFTILNLSGC